MYVGFDILAFGMVKLFFLKIYLACLEILDTIIIFEIRLQCAKGLLDLKNLSFQHCRENIYLLNKMILKALTRVCVKDR